MRKEADNSGNKMMEIDGCALTNRDKRPSEDKSLVMRARSENDEHGQGLQVSFLNKAVTILSDMSSVSPSSSP